MKKARSLILTLAAALGLFAAQTAIAAAPEVVWNGDFMNTKKTSVGGNTYTLSLGAGNTLNGDGTVTLGGTYPMTITGVPNASHITVVLGVKDVQSNASGTLIAYGTGGAPYMCLGNGSIYGGWYDGTSYDDTWSSQRTIGTLPTNEGTQYVSYAYYGKDDSNGQTRGTTFYRNGSQIYNSTGLVGGNEVTQVTIGGNAGRESGGLLTAGFTVTYVALYLETITDASEIATAQTQPAMGTFPLCSGVSAYYNFDTITVRDASQANGSLLGYKWDTDGMVSDPSLAIAYTKDSGAMAVNDALKKSADYYGYFSGGGKNARIYNQSAPALAPTNHGDWSFSMWVGRLSSQQERNPVFLVNGTAPLTANLNVNNGNFSAPTDNSNIGFGLYYLQNGGAKYYFRTGLRFSMTTDGNTFTSYALTSDAAVSTFKSSQGDGLPWHNIIVVRRGTTVTLYVDGAPDRSVTVDADAYIQLPNSAGLYTIKNNAGMDAKDRIDDVCVWNRALTAQEIAAIQSAPAGLYHTDNVAYTGTVTGDSVSFGSNSQMGVSSTDTWIDGEANTITLNNNREGTTTVTLGNGLTAGVLKIAGSGDTVLQLDTDASVTIGQYDFSEATGKTTLNFNWGSSPVKAGSDTVVNTASLGSSTPTVGSGKKITYVGTTALSSLPYTSDAENGTVVINAPVQTTGIGFFRNQNEYRLDASITSGSIQVGNKILNGDTEPTQNLYQDGGSITLTGNSTGTSSPIVLGHWPSRVNFYSHVGTMTALNQPAICGWDGGVQWYVGDGQSANNGNMVVKVKGVYFGRTDGNNSSGNGRDKHLHLQQGGTLNVGGTGLMPHNNKDGNNIKVTLAGGTLACYENATIKLGTNNSSTSGTTTHLAPESGMTMTFERDAIKGAGDFSIDGPGTVALSATPTTTGAFSIADGATLSLPGAITQSLSWGTGSTLIIPDLAVGQIAATSETDTTGLTVKIGSAGGVSASVAVVGGYLVRLPNGTTYADGTLTVTNGASVDARTSATYSAFAALVQNLSIVVANGGALTIASSASTSITVQVGGSLTIVVTDEQLISGYDPTNVTLVDDTQTNVTYQDDEGDIFTGDGKVLAPKVWKWASNSDGAWNEASNWIPASVPTEHQVVEIDKAVTITMTSADTCKSLHIDENATLTGTIGSGGRAHNLGLVTIANDKTLTVESTGASWLTGISGGTLTKTGSSTLNVVRNTDETYAVSGATVNVNAGKLLVNQDNGDPILLDTVFNVNSADASLDNYGWFTATGTLTVNSAYDVTVFNNNSSENNAKITGTPAFVKGGSGTVTLKTGTENSFSSLVINGGTLVFGSTMWDATVSGETSGAGGLSVTGGKTVTLSSGIGYTGATAIAANSTLKVGAATLGMTSGLSGAGTLQLNNVIINNNGTTYSAPSQITSATDWTGVVWLNTADLRYADFGVFASATDGATTKVKLTGAAGYLKNDTTFDGELILEDSGSTVALDVNNGDSGKYYKIKKLSGNGTLKSSGGTTATQQTVIEDAADFTGTVTMEGGANNLKSIRFGSSKAIDDAHRGTISVADGHSVTVPSGKTWTARNRIIVEEGGSLTVNGTLGSKVAGAGRVIYVGKMPDIASTQWTSTDWRGTVVVAGKTGWGDINPNTYGNESSKLELQGVTGYFAVANDATVFAPEVVFENGNYDFAFKPSNGYSYGNNSQKLSEFRAVSGSGTLKQDTGSAIYQLYLIRDGSGFRGSIQQTPSSGAGIIYVFATAEALPKSTLTGSYLNTYAPGSLHILSGSAMTLADGATWNPSGALKISGSLTVAGAGTLTGDTTLASGTTLRFDAAGAALTLSSSLALAQGAVCNIALGNGFVPTDGATLMTWASGTVAGTFAWDSATEATHGSNFVPVRDGNALKIKAMVASVGGANFATLAEALTVANSTGTAESPATVTLLRDYSSTEALSVSGSGVVVIDCGTHTLGAASLTVAANATCTLRSSSPMTFAGTVTVNGTLKTEGDITLSSGSNTVAAGGTLEIVSGTATVNASEQGIAGTLTIDAGATFVNSRTADALSYGGSPTLNVYGTLSMGTTRWTIGGSGTYNFYIGSIVSGTGESTHGALDTIGDQIVTYNFLLKDGDASGTVTLSATLRSRNQMVFNVADNVTVNCSSASAADGDSPTVTKSGNGTLAFVSGANFGSLYNIVVSDGTMLVNGGTISGPVSGPGTLEFTDGTISGSLKDFTGDVTTGAETTINVVEVGGTIPFSSFACGGTFVLTHADGTAIEPGDAASYSTYTFIDNGDGTVTIFCVPQICGAATSFDVTFTNTTAFAYKEESAATSQADSTCTFNNELADTTTGAYLKHHPYINNIPSSWFTNTKQISLAVVGQMPSADNTTFIHMGHSNGANTYGLLFATTSNSNEVKVAWNHSTTVTPITTLTVPNARTTRHSYVVTKDDDDVNNTTTFTVYLDGMKWKTLTVDLFTIVGGFQVGSDFGGAIHGLSTDNTNYVADAKDDDTGYINVCRVYDRVVTQAEITEYARAYPYTSPRGTLRRTFRAADENWIETNSTPWSNSKIDGTVEDSGTPAAGATLALTSEGGGVSVVNNLGTTADYEMLRVVGDPITFKPGDGAGLIRIDGLSTISTTVTNQYGALDLTGGPTVITEGGKLVFDCSTYDASSIVTATEIPLTSDIDEDSTKVFLVPPSTVGRNYALTYISGHYALTITPDHTASANVWIAPDSTYPDNPTVYLQSECTQASVAYPGDILNVSTGATLGNPSVSVGGVTFEDGSIFRVDTTTSEMAFDGGVVTVAVGDTVNVTLGENIPLSGRKILGWTEAPAGNFELSSDLFSPRTPIKASKWGLRKKNDGLYIYKVPLQILVK